MQEQLPRRTTTEYTMSAPWRRSLRLYTKQWPEGPLTGKTGYSVRAPEGSSLGIRKRPSNGHGLDGEK